MLSCLGCEKSFDPEHPDVEKFVKQVKNGTYNCYEKGENGKNLWLIMPDFNQNHIQALICHSKDTSQITNFPFNPISSRTPFPYNRQYLILGECLLWTVEGIRNGNRYGSLDPYLIDIQAEDRNKGLKGVEILIVRNLYNDWWIAFKDKDWKNKNPLESTSFRWF